MNEQTLGLLTGIAFGFLLQKGRVLRFEKQVGALRLRDMTILKFMLSAILVGMIGIYFLQEAGWIELRHKSMNAGAVIIGGVLFGLGWAVMGFCPGTSIGALAEGRWHAVWAVMGMIAGAAIFAEIYPFFKKTVLPWMDFGKISLADASGLPHGLLIVGLAAVYIGLFVFFEKKKL
jgi:uncharacterized membrane protein YedE/YeeE